MYRPAPAGQGATTRLAGRAPKTISQPADRIPHAQMTAAIDEGTAQTLSQTITDIARHLGSWWLYDRDEWIRAEDTELIASLDAAAALMAPYDQQIRSQQRKP